MTRTSVSISLLAITVAACGQVIGGAEEASDDATQARKPASKEKPSPRGSEDKTVGEEAPRGPTAPPPAGTDSGNPKSEPASDAVPADPADPADPGAPGAPGAPTTPAGTPPPKAIEIPKAIPNFSLPSASKDEINMIILVDNKTVKPEFRPKAARNLDALFRSTEGKKHIQITLITQLCTKPGLNECIGVDYQKFPHVNFMNNWMWGPAPNVLSQGLCPPLSDAGKYAGVELMDMMCSGTWTFQKSGGDRDPSRGIGSKVYPLMHKGARHVYVLMGTSDASPHMYDSKRYTDQRFKELVRWLATGSKHSFNMIGVLPRAQRSAAFPCENYNESRVLNSYAADLNGKAYSGCEDDWTPFFKEILTRE